MSRPGRLVRLTVPKCRFLDQIEVIREEPASEVGSLAFLSRLLVQANLPYREPPEPFFVRRNGALTLTLQAPPQIGLPFGRYPRLLLAWLGTEAIRNRSPEIELGESLSATMRELGITPSGGGNGPFERFRDQMRRLFNTTITYSWDERRPRGRLQADAGYRITDSVLWWEPTAEPGGKLKLSEAFFQELLRHPVPVDFRVLRALASPLAIDIYAWLSYRSFTSSDRPVTIPWPLLAAQFGTNGSVRKFRENFERALGAVLAVYHSATVEAMAAGLRIAPGKPHVQARLPRRGDAVTPPSVRPRCHEYLGTTPVPGSVLRAPSTGPPVLFRDSRGQDSRSSAENPEEKLWICLWKGPVFHECMGTLSTNTWGQNGQEATNIWGQTHEYLGTRNPCKPLIPSGLPAPPVVLPSSYEPVDPPSSRSRRLRRERSTMNTLVSMPREQRRPPRTTLPHDPFEALGTPVEEPGRAGEVELRRVPLSAIDPSPQNPRKVFSAEGIAELAASISADGLRQPLELRRSPGDRGRFEVVAGERRFRALSKLAAEGRLAADHGVAAQVVTELDDATMLLRALVENLQRQDLHPLEEADAFARLRDEHGLSTEQIATKAGKSQRWVQLRIALTELVPEARAAFADGRIGLVEARRLAGLGEGQQRRGLVGLLGGRPEGPTEEPTEEPGDEPRDALDENPPPHALTTPSPSPAARRGEPERMGGGVPRPLAGEGSRVREALARALADSYPLALRFALTERQAGLGEVPVGELFRLLADLPLAELEVQFAEAVADSLHSASPVLLTALSAELGLAEVA